MLAALLGVAVSAPAQRTRAPQARKHAAVQARPVSGSAFRERLSAARYRPARGVAAPRSARGVVAGSLDVRLRGRSSGVAGCGRWVTRTQQVLVPGHWDRRYVPATHGWVLDVCGLRIWGVLSPAGYQDVWVPARYETQRRRVWQRY